MSLKRNIIILFITILVFISVSFSSITQRTLSSASLQKLEASHRIKNQIILTPINKLIKKSNGNIFLNVILVRIDSINRNKKNVYLRASNLATEKMYFQVDKNTIKPKGYLYVNDILILLYNDTNTFFSKINEPEDVLKSDEKFKLFPEIHTSYYYYSYSKDTIYGNIEEYIELKGEMDYIED